MVLGKCIDLCDLFCVWWLHFVRFEVNGNFYTLKFAVFFFLAVNINIVDEDQKKAFQSYDPQAPVTRKGILRSLRTGRPIEIREEDLVCTFV